MTKEELTKDFIKSTFMKDGKFIAGRMNKKYLQKRGYYDVIINYYSDSKSIKETLYRILNDIDEIPSCKMCDNKVSFKSTNSYNLGYATYCSKACQNRDPYMREINAKAVSIAMKQKYKNDGEQIKQKRAYTLNEHYGVYSSTPFKIKEISDKARNTVLKNNDDHYPKRPNNQQRAWEQSIQLQKERGVDISYHKDEDGQVYVTVYNCCPIHGDVVLTKEQFNNRTNYNKNRAYKELCILCHPENNSESTFERDVKDVLIKRCNIDEHDIKQHDRTILNGKEIDLLLLKYNLAIECNGIFWHQGVVGLKKHKNKKMLCDILGIRYIMIWEDEFYNNTDEIVDFINHLINNPTNDVSEFHHDNDNQDFFFANLLTYERKMSLSNDDISTNRWVRCFHLSASLLKYNIPNYIETIYDEYKYFNDEVKIHLNDKPSYRSLF